MNKQDQEKEFCNRHHINILDTNKRRIRARLMPRYFGDPTDYNVVETSPITESESIYVVEIPESEFRNLIDFEAQVFNNMKINGHYNLFELLLQQKEEEKFLRENYPAVQKAYEQYSLMLKLAGSGGSNAGH